MPRNYFMSGQSVTIELDKRGRTNLCCANNNQPSELFADTNFSQRLPFLLVGARLPAQPSVRGAFGGFALLKTVQNRIQGISLDSVLLGFCWTCCSCVVRVFIATHPLHMWRSHVELLLQDLLVIAIYRKNFHVLQPTLHPDTNCLARVLTS